MVARRMGRTDPFFRTEILRRALAAGAAVLILALGLLAASPSLHDRLHTCPQAAVDDGCAVALFASGVAVAVPVVALPPPATEWRELPQVVSPEILLESPRYLLRPERGPPVA